MINKSLNKMFPILALVLSGCMNNQVLPYVVTEPTCRVGKLENNYDFAGIHFTLYNNTDKQIKNFSCTCTIFDSDGDNPFIGNNCIIAKSNNPINSADNSEVIIKLDPYMNWIPEKPFIIENFYVTKIEYSDGTVWKDSIGAFRQGGF